MTRSVALVYDPIFKQHDPGPYHPESPARCDAVLSAIKSSVPEESYTLLDPRMATKEEVLLAHTEEYFDLARNEIESGWPTLSTGDTDVCKDSFEPAMRAVGGCPAQGTCVPNSPHHFESVFPG